VHYCGPCRVVDNDSADHHVTHESLARIEKADDKGSGVSTLTLTR
jgi:hypothetical protein